MKFRYLLILLLVPFLLITSCKREEDRIFDTNATVRMTEAVKNTYSVLQGNKGGWVMKFYPSSNHEFGGYTIFTKFLSSEQVSIASDPFSGSITSSYSVSPESGPVITFNGYNKNIHWFSEPGLDNGGVVGNGTIGADDSGMRGDFEFIVLKATADSVVLKGKKRGSHLVMLPLKDGEFESMSTAYQEATRSFNQFSMYKFENSKGETSAIIFSPKARVFEISTDQGRKAVSFRVIPAGIEFYEQYTIDGVAFDQMSFVAPSVAYQNGYYTDKNNKIKIIPVTPPLNVWFKNNLWSMSYKNTGSTGRIYWDRARTTLNTNKIIVNYAYIGSFQGTVGLIYILQGGAVFGGVSHYIDPVEATNDLVDIGLEGYLIGNFPVAYWAGGINNFTTPFNGRRFKITSDGSLNPRTVTLTDIAIPTNTFKLVMDDIEDPLNN